MNIKVHSSELSRMMKTVCQCLDTRSENLGNIEIVYDNNLLTIRGTNGSISAVMSTPVLGGDGEVFCVDGTMFAKVCAMCSGEVNISTDGKVCTVKGAGRTRLPIVKAKIPAFEPVHGKTCTVKADAFSRGYGCVAHSISDDQGRIQLTGVLIESADDGVVMVTLDGFMMSVEPVECDTDEMKIIVPGSMMKLISASTYAGDTITICTDGKRIQASTDGMMLSCALIAGEYPDYRRLLPTGFKTECITHADQILSALKSGSVVNTANNLVKLNVSEDDITVMSNSEQADFEAEVSCMTNGDGLKIAFNHKYLMETIGSVIQNEITMKFNAPTNPCIIQGKGSDGLRLLLPVRVMG